MKIRTLAVLTFLSLAGCAHAQPQPLFGSFPMENAAATEAGPQNLTVKAQNVTPVAGKSGGALRFDGPASKIEISGPRIKDLTVQFSLAFWLKVEKFPATGRVYIVTKGLNNGWQLGIGDKGQVMFHGGYGGGFYDTPWKGKIAPDTWTHVALTFERGGAMRIYLNGQEVLESQVPFAVWRSDDPIRVGNAHWTAAIDDLQIFAAALSSAQVQTLAKGQPLPTRAPTEADFPSQGYPVKLSLGRFDQPLAFRPYDGRRLQDARRMPAPDAVDWPVLKLNGSKRVFKDGPTENAEVVLRGGGESKDLFRDARDNSITPINHWFRANSFLWGRTFVYTTDRTARTSSGDYELWTFPIQIKGENAGDIQSVVLKLGGETIYERGEKLRSLTLLLPANLGGSPYELVVNNRPPVRFDAGLKPVALGKPEDEPLQVNLTIPGGGPKITVQNLAASPVFPHPKEWAADLKALAAGPEFAAPPVPQLAGFGRFLGLSVPRAPVEIFTSSMRHGMSGGHFLGGGHIAGFQGTADEYAAFLASQGYDFAIEDAFPKTLEESVKLDQWMAAMTRRGLKAGVNPDTPGNLGILGNPNLAFQSSFLPEWGAPAFRDAQLLAQRFGKYPAFLGLLIGADNGGYVTYWDWAPTIPDRPWGRAYEIFQQGRARVTPVGPALSPSKSWEKKATQREFLNYIARYDETFKRYGYFARAVQEVRPDAILTTGSYGSSPGGGGRGGWPWATIPGVPMHENLPVQTAYDWNEHGSSKPLHNLALVDRLQSYFPQKPTWALIDDFGLFFGREARQRAYALALTRGVDAVGTTFLAHETGDQNYRSGQMVRFEETPRERPAVVREQRELYDWIHRTSGAYQSARPLASVGVLYIHQQAVSRQIQGSEKPTEKDLYGGSHEGKTTEALFLSHQAGWPAKIITPEELKRGLPPEMKAILLVGLNRFDQTWLWSEGIEGELKKFVAGGGKLIADSETVLPEGVAATKTALKVAAYTTQSKEDVSPQLLARNLENVRVLQSAMAGIEMPLATGSDTVWAVPHQNGDTQYVTVVNWGFEEGKNASQVVKPQVGKLVWNTTRPIYDVRSGQKLSPQQAQSADLTKDGFRLFALPPREVAAPAITTARGSDGFWTATVATGASGVPVRLEISGNGDGATLFGSSGVPIKLPVGPSDAGTFQLSASELLLNGSAQAQLKATPAPVAAPDPPEIALRRFAARREIPLVIALTPEQQKDPQFTALAEKISAFYTAKGRKVETRALAAGDVVQSLQPLKSQQKFPQWRTIAADLVLLGTPQTNVLLFDQARGGLLEREKEVQVTYSPFVGEYQALNLIASDTASLAMAWNEAAR